MGNWRKLLARMAADPKPLGYRYEDAARILRQLGFTCAPHGGTSHRHWRRRLPNGTLVVVGLVDAGNSTLKAVYVKELVAALRAHHLLPPLASSDAPSEC